jgi:CheY-like chemotaxis protein
MRRRTQGRGHLLHVHRALVVEDSTDWREAVADLLHASGYHVVAVPDGAMALKAIQTLGFQPCVVIVDLHMPVMDGFSFRRHALHDAGLADIPMIGVTGHEPLYRRALGEGFPVVLRKPSDIDVLMAELVRLMDAGCRRAGPAASAGPDR